MQMSKKMFFLVTLVLKMNYVSVIVGYVEILGLKIDLRIELATPEHLAEAKNWNVVYRLGKQRCIPVVNGQKVPAQC